MLVWIGVSMVKLLAQYAYVKLRMVTGLKVVAIQHGETIGPYPIHE